METTHKAFGIIALSALIGLFVTGCPNPANEGNDKFVSSTNDATDNNETTLGLVGTTVTSSDANVAKTEIADGKIAITSVSKGSAVISVSDASDHAAKIPVSVSETGTITIGTIVKYVPESSDPITITGLEEFAGKYVFLQVRYEDNPEDPNGPPLTMLVIAENIDDTVTVPQIDSNGRASSNA